MSKHKAYVLTLFFLGTWLGYCNASTTLIFGGFRGHSNEFVSRLKCFEKWWPDRSERNVQRNELIAPGQNIAFSRLKEKGYPNVGN